jgi:type II secretory pathway pseudopilin PulG
MKAIAVISMVLGSVVLLFGVLGLNIVLALIGCVGLLAGFGVNRQLTYNQRLSRMESQLRIILQTQRQPASRTTSPFEVAEDSSSEEQDAFEFLQDG